MLATGPAAISRPCGGHFNGIDTVAVIEPIDRVQILVLQARHCDYGVDAETIITIPNTIVVVVVVVVLDLIPRNRWQLCDHHR